MTETLPPTRPPEVPHIAEFTIRALNPENAQDLAVARTLDRAAAEALNPFAQEKPPEASHDLMTDEELARWSRDSATSMLRVVEDAQGKAIGFTYFYNDSHNDPEFRRRAQTVRTKQGLPSNHAVWEMNFWFNPGTSDELVEKGVRGALKNFGAKRARQATTVMFADAGDVKESYRESTGSRLKLQEIAKNPRVLTEATEAFQDSRILDKVGFRFVDRIRYDEEAQYLDLAYTMEIGKKTIV